MSEHIIASGSYFSAADLPITARFEPKPDITAYELARLLPYLQGHPLYRKSFNEMPYEARRHLIVATAHGQSAALDKKDMDM